MDETPAKVGDQRGLQRLWATAEEHDAFHPDLKRDKTKKASQLQFIASFCYGFRGPKYMFWPEDKMSFEKGRSQLEEENRERDGARVLTLMSASQVNEQGHAQRIRTPGKRGPGKINNLTPQERDWMKPFERKGTNGGIDAYRYREEWLKPHLFPWLLSLDSEYDKRPLVLSDNAPSHSARLSQEAMNIAEVIRVLMPAGSPDVDAIEHAWPWLRTNITKHMSISKSEEECEQQWYEQWEKLDVDTINKWIDRIPGVIRNILKTGGDNCFNG